MPQKQTASPPDDKLISALIDQALDGVGPYSYIGVSYKNLLRFNEYQQEGLELTGEDLNLTQLYAGLSVLSAAYDREQKTAAKAKYIEIVREVHEEDKKMYKTGAFPYKSRTFPYPSELDQINTIVAKSLSVERPNLSILENHKIRHEWTVKPGRKLFQKFLKKLNAKLKKLICQADVGILSKIKSGGDEKDAIKEILLAILPLLGIGGKFLSIGVLLSTILVTRGLGLYCEGYSSPPAKKTSVSPKKKSATKKRKPPKGK